MKVIFSKFHKRLFAAGCLAAMLTLTVAAAAQDTISGLDRKQDGYVIPFAYDPPLIGMPIIQASINGAAPMPFVVDTGSPYPLLIDNWAATKLKLRPTGKSFPVTQTNPKITLFEDSLESFSIPARGPFASEPFGDADIPLKTAYSGDLGFPDGAFGGLRVAGIIGAGTLNDVTACFDFAAKTLTVFVKPHPRLRIPGATTLPMKEDGGYYLVDVSLPEGTSTALMVDTGRDFTTVPDAFESKLNPLGVGIAEYETMQGEFAGTKYLLSAIKLGDFTEPKVMVCSQLTDAISALGLNILSRFRVTLDFPNKEMTLERLADYRQRIQVDGKSGIGLVRRNGQYYVDTVEDGSPAYKAGVRKGDCVTSIDGHDIASLSLTMALLLLDGNADSRAELTLERADGQKTQATFVRDTAFNPPPPPRFGFAMEGRQSKPNDLRMTVVSVTKGLPADKAGLLPGDEIIEMEGLPMATITLDQLKAIRQRPQIVLKIRRKGEQKPLVFRLRAEQTKT